MMSDNQHIYGLKIIYHRFAYNVFLKKNNENFTSHHWVEKSYNLFFDDIQNIRAKTGSNVPSDFFQK